MEEPRVAEPVIVAESVVIATEVRVVTPAEPAIITEETGIVTLPRVPEPVLLKRMTKRPVLLGVGESGCCHRPRQSQQ